MRGLTEEERRVLRLLAQGLLLPAVARRLGISYVRARSVAATLRNRYGADTLVQAVFRATLAGELGAEVDNAALRMSH